MKKILFATYFLYSLISLAQNTDFSATLSYPLPLSDGTFNEYTGIADIGLQYGFYESGPWQLGASVNGSTYTRDEALTGLPGTVTENTTLIQPRLFAALKVGQDETFRPFVGVGYTFGFFGIKFDANGGPPDENDTGSGLNVAAGATIEIAKQLFVIVQYDYVGFSSFEGGTNFRNSENLGTAKLGLGYRF